MTSGPTAAWVWHQLIAATPWGRTPRYLVLARDAVYGRDFVERARRLGIETLLTPIRAPRANAICERLLGSVRRECLDHILIVSEAHLRRVLNEYVLYFNRSRPHQGISQKIPVPQESAASTSGERATVIAFPVLGGLHHDYRCAA